MNKSHPFRKKWGQNFLVDQNLLEKIVRTINPEQDESILEIGPGEGALTEKLLPNVGEMLAVEIDPLLIKHLNNHMILSRCHFVQGDILKQDIEDLPISNPVRVMGNIPYNITSPIIFWLVEQQDFWNDAFLMVQKELAERLVATCGSKTYSRITVMVGVYLDVKLCFTIPPEVFIPRPKIHSAFIRFTKKKTPLVSDEKYERFYKIVKAAFSQRRKMLRNTLKGFTFPEGTEERIDFTRRPETLTLEEFASLV
ncbi:MAG: 16S rRNA (adenine(1518)-N(6)/adenine(1519)-N(6))-dimethyltransferase RsmA [Candidatus Marinimicrobia bacterium]|jgi:16S rRNA (adenine1518-N6/adenine1519-N6)-dimethyltransferase|nr:16S rRNA (adenine(1518)-N(6)/adenine(1519)-N(6))-dimethyltransferase RsmA [Candidatus Neomarinimicrobiota bacterium]MBT3495787.1 16S rRNA (adenine(1518)-N(6)/adenine(1519)-N(6))-dimethyltransferase RsmA [Candidatus Neomarinimicrobiota bacterium]MBT3691652.1 16S rRNA (adenine(1518)-N(6)/adenine(1519)-N(6))-dimethyltransferase RsmA [Candidatus Neomarinimicrobiota bacterium]MBT3732745.1 16S rRNA (adenine(1518)-N(6)/adenine(1519)-N(6))-dimethyltransferase RsmA [Candidatus Neomarinimicrobiota bact